MAYIPRNAEWYVAELVDETVVEGDSRNVVHRNLTLIHANSPDEAYDRAIELGKQSTTQYQNPAGKGVVVKFRGIAALSVVHDKLEHGAELRYIEEVSVPEAKIAELIKTREQLSIFRDIQPTEGPDYACREIVNEALELMANDRDNRN